jgi:hypothetical protein
MCFQASRWGRMQALMRKWAAEKPEAAVQGGKRRNSGELWAVVLEKRSSEPPQLTWECRRDRNIDANDAYIVMNDSGLDVRTVRG